MLNALTTAASGMKAQERRIDNIANNLANVNTTGFKRSRLEFQDLLYHRMPTPGGTQDDPAPNLLEIGHGTAVVASTREQTQGDLTETGNPLDVVIEGDGYFQVSRSTGQLAYTRDGSFRINADGRLVTTSGHPLEPEIVVPADAQSVAISPDGVVQAYLHGEDYPVEVGTILLARFVNPGGLSGLGRNLLGWTPASGEPLVDSPGERGLGSVRQGFLEASNVEVVNEMVQMIMAQRAYEVASKAIQTSDEMLELANNIRR